MLRYEDTFQSQPLGHFVSNCIGSVRYHDCFKLNPSALYSLFLSEAWFDDHDRDWHFLLHLELAWQLLKQLFCVARKGNRSKDVTNACKKHGGSRLIVKHVVKRCETHSFA